MNLDAFASANNHPPGWSPGIELQGDSGTVTTGPLQDNPNWDDVLKVWNLDPSIYRVIEPVEMRAWDTYSGRFYYYKAKFETITTADSVDLSALIKDARRQRAKNAPQRAKNAPQDSTLAILLTDWQAGKPEGGGTPALAERLLARLPALVDAAKHHDSVALLCLGDLVENCFGFYPMQLHQVDRNMRQQAEFVTEMLYEYVRTLSKVSRETIVATVPGNHGELRVDGKAVTDFADNWDLDVVARVQRICDENPKAFGGVSFVIADQLSLVVELSGVKVGMTHGHAGRTYNPEKVRQWWANNALSGTAIGQAQILVSGHYHHCHIDENNGRAWFQAPAMDGGSEWYTASTGKTSPAGMLTIEIGAKYGERGWGAVRVL